MKDKRKEERRKNDRRKENRGIVDRRGVMDRRNENFQETKNKDRNFDDQVEGRNSVLELLESGKDINKIFITKGEKHG